MNPAFSFFFLFSFFAYPRGLDQCRPSVGLIKKCEGVMEDMKERGTQEEEEEEEEDDDDDDDEEIEKEEKVEEEEEK